MSRASASYTSSPMSGAPGGRGGGEGMKKGQGSGGGGGELAYDNDMIPGADEIDASQYPTLQAAYSALTHAYQKQRQTFSSYMSSWKLERQELKAGEEALTQALQSVREALEAETRAHDLDLQTLETFMARNKVLEGQLAALRGGDRSHRPPTGQQAAHGPSQGAHGVSHGSGELKSVLKHASEMEKPITDTDPDGKMSVVGLQRYCPETDSYRLVKTEQPKSSEHQQQPPVHVTSPTTHHDELRKNNISLMKQVDELRKVNHELWEAYERHPLGTPAAQSHQKYGTPGAHSLGALVAHTYAAATSPRYLSDHTHTIPQPAFPQSPLTSMVPTSTYTSLQSYDHHLTSAYSPAAHTKPYPSYTASTLYASPPHGAYAGSPHRHAPLAASGTRREEFRPMYRIFDSHAQQTA